MNFLNIFKHLLPNARAWKMTVTKNLRKFFEGLTGVGVDVKIFFDLILYDMLPATTRELEAWEKQFGLINTGLTEQQRRERLAAAWQDVGGQDPRYIQDTLHDHGFDVYVHEWWVPGTEPAIGVPCATPRNPLIWLRDSEERITYTVECNEPLAQCGEVGAEAGERVDPPGYALVNKVYESVINTLGAGEPLAQCGEEAAECGNILGYGERFIDYIIPVDPLKWPYFLYIGGETFGTLAQVDPKRKDEFEDLCLKICPTQQWLGIIVEYV